MPPPLTPLRLLVRRRLHKTIYAVKTRSFYKELGACDDPETPSRNVSLHYEHNDRDIEVAVEAFSLKLRAAFNHERAMREAVSDLEGKRIVTLLASHQVHDHYFLLLPLAHSNLHDYWTNTDPIPKFESYTCWFVEETKELMKALECLHRMSRRGSSFAPPVGIVHGDIKPRNILIYQDNRRFHPILKWNDFGLSFWADTVSGSRTTRIYDAPENGLQSRLGTKSDVWSFGCVLLEFAVWLLHGYDGLQTFGA